MPATPLVITAGSRRGRPRPGRPSAPGSWDYPAGSSRQRLLSWISTASCPSGRAHRRRSRGPVSRITVITRGSRSAAHVLGQQVSDQRERCLPLILGEIVPGPELSGMRLAGYHEPQPSQRSQPPRNPGQSILLKLHPTEICPTQFPDNGTCSDAHLSSHRETVGKTWFPDAEPRLVGPARAADSPKPAVYALAFRPADSSAMYCAYQSGQSGSACPISFSCLPCAASARRSASARAATEP
jgi:hypothetical protein